MEFETQEFGGWQFPASEVHMREHMGPGSKAHNIVRGRWHYQHHKLMAAMEFLPADRRRVAIDIGAHVGTWLFHLIELFDYVHAFEPVPIHQHCLELNMEGQGSNWHLWKQGLSNRCDIVSFHWPTETTGDAHVAGPKKANHGDPSPIDTIPNIYLGYLDQHAFEDVDFIKIDVEGHELQVCQGARETLLRCKPVVVLEQKGMEEKFYGRPRDEALGYLIDELGMRSACEVSGDHVLVWS